MSGRKADRAQWKPTWEDIVLTSVLGGLIVGQIVLCVLFYNWAGLDVLSYIGWATLGVAFFVFGGWLAAPFRMSTVKGKEAILHGSTPVA